MTYGLLISRARMNLGEAAAALAGGHPAGPVDVLALTSLRATLYRQVARHADLLLPATDRNPPWHTPATGDRLYALRDRLRAAANDAPMPMSSVPIATSPAVAALAVAADCLGGAGDILASHLEPIPRTPEGAAIRAGGGAVSAMAELARLTFEAIAVDLEVPGWLDRTDIRSQAVGEPLTAAALRTTTGTMPHALGRVRAMAPIGPPLLRDLAGTPAIDPTEAPIHDAADAATRLSAARTWLWRHPERVTAAHLRLGAQLGLAALTSIPGTSGHRSAAGLWRHAAAITSGIEGTPATGEALAAARQLSDALTWTRATDHNPSVPIPGLATQLPSLADTLLTGTRHAVHRGDLFVPYTEPTTVRPGVVRITSGWRRADAADPDIASIFVALAQLATDQPRIQRRTAARAFQQPSQAATRTQPAPAPVPASPAAAPRGRTR